MNPPRIRPNIAGLMFLAGALSSCTSGIEAPLGPSDLNRHSRLDRAPLMQNQRPDVVSVQSLWRGVYRTRADQIVSESWPSAMEDVVSSLPQSTCMWLGRDGMTGEALRLNWELESPLPDETLEAFELTDDVQNLAHCRMNDPVTRQPPRGVNGSDNFVEVEPNRYRGDVARIAFSFEGSNFPRLMSDIYPYFAKMKEYPVTGDPFNGCSDSHVADPAGVVTVNAATVGYTGPVLDADVITSCSGPFGQTLFPARDAVYEIAATSGNPIGFLHPAVKVAEPGETLARALTQDGSTLRWSTPSQGNSGANVYWEENFSRRIHVTAVRFFTLNGSTRQYLDTTPERMCIHDPQFGSGCRWRCDATADPAGSVYRMEADSANVQGCRSGDLPANPPEHPAATPTYAKERLCEANTDPNCSPILQPLEWSIASGIANGQAAYIEFELEPVFEGMALKVAPTGANLGAAAVGEQLQASFEIRNIGGVPIEIDDVRTVPHAQSAVNASAMVLDGAEAFPLPLRLDEYGLRVEQSMVYPRYRVQEGGSFNRLVREPVEEDTLTIQGHTVQVQGRFIIRDQMETSLVDETLADEYHPFHSVSFVEHAPPFALMPDEAASVVVSVTPTAYQGLDGGNGHLLWLHVEGYNQNDPQERQTADIPIVLEALLGPALHTTPASISLPFRGMEPPAGSIGSLMVANYGDMNLTLTHLAIAGRDAARFTLLSPPAVPLTLPAGDARVLRVQYHSVCDANAWQGHLASLELSTNHHGGTVALWGAADCTLNLP